MKTHEARMEAYQQEIKASIAGIKNTVVLVVIGLLVVGFTINAFVLN